MESPSFYQKNEACGAVAICPIIYFAVNLWSCISGPGGGWKPYTVGSSSRWRRVVGVIDRSRLPGCLSIILQIRSWRVIRSSASLQWSVRHAIWCRLGLIALFRKIMALKERPMLGVICRFYELDSLGNSQLSRTVRKVQPSFAATFFGYSRKPASVRLMISHCQ